MDKKEFVVENYTLFVSDVQVEPDDLMAVGHQPYPDDTFEPKAELGPQLECFKGEELTLQHNTKHWKLVGTYAGGVPRYRVTPMHDNVVKRWQWSGGHWEVME